MRVGSDQLCMQASPGSADLLTSLSEQLLILEEFISNILFVQLMEKITEGLDQVILTEVSACKSVLIANSLSVLCTCVSYVCLRGIRATCGNNFHSKCWLGSMW